MRYQIVNNRHRCVIELQGAASSKRTPSRAGPPLLFVLCARLASSHETTVFQAKPSARHLAVRVFLRLGEQVRKDGEDPAVVGLARRETELVEARASVLLYGAVDDGQSFANGLVGAPFGDQLEHLALARRQRS